VESEVSIMTITEMEKEIIKAIRIEAEIPLASNVGYYNLIKFVKKLFKEFKDE
jgi:3-deoxy-D-manno-octulosonic-acid transferase